MSRVSQFHWWLTSCQWVENCYQKWCLCLPGSNIETPFPLWVQETAGENVSGSVHPTPNVSNSQMRKTEDQVGFIPLSKSKNWWVAKAGLESQYSAAHIILKLPALETFLSDQLPESWNFKTLETLLKMLSCLNWILFPISCHMCWKHIIQTISSQAKLRDGVNIKIEKSKRL